MPTTRAVSRGARTSIPPALAGEVPRPVVDRVLSDASRLPLTIVTAGPGWGKTTAVASWARRLRDEAGGAVAWLTLRPADDTPAAFWCELIRAVNGSGSVPEDNPLRLLSTAGGVNSEVLLAIFRGLDALPQPIVLVLDDFHVVSSAEVLADLIDLVSLRTRAHIVLVTRVDPPIALHRLRLAGDLVEVNSSDLAFDARDVRRLAAGSEALELTDSGLEEVLARTEGWPAGVRLAAMYLARVGADAGLERFGGTDRSVAEYLVAEVLLRNSPEVRDFLLRTSVVELVSGELADAIAPGGQGHTRLASLVEANQFIVSVNAEGTVFRYHPLLRDLLVHTLRLENSSAFREAHVAAASWFLTHRKPVRAMGHAVAAEDWELAATAFFEASPGVVGARSTDLVEHLRAIPYASLEPCAARELCAAALEFCQGHFSAMEEHVQASRRLLSEGDQLPPVALAFLENLACAAARARGDEDSVAAAAQAALEQVSATAPAPAAEGNRLIATTQYAVALLRAGDIAGARARLMGVVRDTPRGDVELMLLGTRAHLAWCDFAEGDLDSAIARAGAVIEDAVVRGWTSQMQLRFAYLPLALAQMLRGEFDSADRHLAAGLAADANGVEAWPATVLHLAQACVAVSRRRPRAATAAFQTALAMQRDHPVSAALADTWTRVSAEVAMLTGGRGRAIVLGDGAPMSATGWSTQARLALHRGDLDGAQNAASRVPRSPDPGTVDDLIAAIEAAICDARVARKQGRPIQAAHSLGEALRTAAPQLILRPFLGPDCGDLSALLRATAVNGDAAVLRDSALLRLGDAGEMSSRPEVEPLIEPLTERELAVLAELPTMRTNEEIAQDFYVSVNTIKSHLSHLYRKLGVGTRRDAVRRARDLGLLA